MGHFKKYAIAAAVSLALALPARAQTLTPGLPVVPMGHCQLNATALAGAVGLASCVGASLTATCSGSVLTAASVTGAIKIGQTITGTGVSQTVVSFGTGTGGAGTYNMSAACTASSASSSATGIPSDAQGHSPNIAVLQNGVASSSIRFKDDGSAPTSTLGLEIIPGVPPYTYAGTLSALQFIAGTGSGILDVGFYRSP
jgi:hypothetical protein